MCIANATQLLVSGMQASHIHKTKSCHTHSLSVAVTSLLQKITPHWARCPKKSWEIIWALQACRQYCCLHNSVKACYVGCHLSTDSCLKRCHTVFAGCELPGHNTKWLAMYTSLINNPRTNDCHNNCSKINLSVKIMLHSNKNTTVQDLHQNFKLVF